MRKMYISKGQKFLSYLPPYTQYLELYLVCIQCSKYIIIKVLQGRSSVAQTLTNLSRVQETQVQSLGQEDPLEKEMSTHSSILAWRIPWIEEAGRLQSMGLPGSEMTKQLTLSLSRKIWYNWWWASKFNSLLICFRYRANKQYTRFAFADYSLGISRD